MTISSVSKLHFPSLVLIAIINSLMALSEDKLSRMYMLAAVLVLQHAAFLLFMVDYDRTAQEAYKKKYKKIT